MAGKLLLLLTRAERYQRCLFAAVRGLWHGKKGVRKEQETLVSPLTLSIIPSPSSRVVLWSWKHPSLLSSPFPSLIHPATRAKSLVPGSASPRADGEMVQTSGAPRAPPSQGECSKAKATGCGQGQLPGSRSAQELHHEADFLGSYVLKTQPIF